MNKYFLFAFALFGLLLSCNDSELFTPGDEFLGGGITAGSYQVELNGNLWRFDDMTEAHSDAFQSYVNGTNDNGNTISISKLGPLSVRSEEHTSELQSRGHLVCRLLLE